MTSARPPDDSPAQGPGPSAPPAPAPTHGEGNAAAVVALVLGIVGILGAFVSVGLLGVILGVAAIIFGVRGRRKVDAGRTTQRRGLATGGLVTGIVATVLGVLIIALVVVGISVLSDNPELQREIERRQQR